jgi:O-antigen/teichoic acid export membrane protein
VVLQSRFLAPEGRGTFVLAVLTVSIFSRLLSQLGVAVANYMGHKEWDEPDELRALTQRAFGIAVALGIAGGAVIVGIGALTPSVGAATAAVASVALVPNVVWQTASGVLLGLGRIRAWNYVRLASPLATVIGTLILVVGLGGGVRAALAAWTAAHVVAAALALGLTRDVWRPFSLGSLVDRTSQALLRLALTMGALQVISLIGYRIELFVLEAIDGVRAVGVYSIANQAAESMWLMSSTSPSAAGGRACRSPRAS